MLSNGEAAPHGGERLRRALNRSNLGSTESHPTVKEVAVHRFSQLRRLFESGWILGFSPLDPLQPIPAGHGQSRPVTVIFARACVHCKAPPRIFPHSRVPGVPPPKAVTKPEKSEKSEKSVFSISQLESAAAQFVPNKIEGWEFSDFSKNFRGYMGGIRKG